MDDRTKNRSNASACSEEYPIADKNHEIIKTLFSIVIIFCVQSCSEFHGDLMCNNISFDDIRSSTRIELVELSREKTPSFTDIGWEDKYSSSIKGKDYGIIRYSFEERYEIVYLLSSVLETEGEKWSVNKFTDPSPYRVLTFYDDDKKIREFFVGKNHISINACNHRVYLYSKNNNIFNKINTDINNLIVTIKGVK